MKRLLILCAASIAGSCALRAAVETTTSAAAEFNLYIADGASYALASAADFAAWSITWRSGETVTATAWDGAATTLADGTAGAASASLPSGKGGVWTLANSAQGTARVGVAWAVFGDGGMLAAGAESSAYGVDSVQPGPNRRTSRAAALPVAYTGDDWARGAAATSTLTFTAPDGTATAMDKTGTGTEPFAFGKTGVWTVKLAMADGTTIEATITLIGDLSVVIR